MLFFGQKRALGDAGISPSFPARRGRGSAFSFGGLRRVDFRLSAFKAPGVRPYVAEARRDAEQNAYAEAHGPGVELAVQPMPPPARGPEIMCMPMVLAMPSSPNMEPGRAGEGRGFFFSDMADYGWSYEASMLSIAE